MNDCITVYQTIMNTELPLLITQSILGNMGFSHFAPSFTRWQNFTLGLVGEHVTPYLEIYVTPYKDMYTFYLPLFGAPCSVTA